MLDTVGDDNILMRTENKSTYHFNKDDKLLFHSNKIDIRPLKKLVKNIIFEEAIAYCTKRPECEFTRIASV